MLNFEEESKELVNYISVVDFDGEQTFVDSEESWSEHALMNEDLVGVWGITSESLWEDLIWFNMGGLLKGVID